MCEILQRRATMMVVASVIVSLYLVPYNLLERERLREKILANLLCHYMQRCHHTKCHMLLEEAKSERQHVDSSSLTSFPQRTIQDNV